MSYYLFIYVKLTVLHSFQKKEIKQEEFKLLTQIANPVITLINNK